MGPTSPVVSLLLPEVISIDERSRSTLTVSGRRADGTIDPDVEATWRSLNNRAVVEGKDVLLGRERGTGLLEATIDGVVDSVVVSVREIPVGSVSITEDATVVTGSDRGDVPIMVWSEAGDSLFGRAVKSVVSSNPPVASVRTILPTREFRYRAFVPGQATLTATVLGVAGREISGSHDLTVVEDTVRTIELRPDSLSMRAGEERRVRVRIDFDWGQYNLGTIQGDSVTWSFSPAGIASVSGDTLVRGIIPGAGTMTVTFHGNDFLVGGLSATGPLVITP